MLVKPFIWSIILLASFYGFNAKPNAYATSVECRIINGSVIEKFVCILAPTGTYGSGYLIIKTDVYRDLEMEIIFDVLSQGTTRNFLRYRADVCQMLESTQKIKMFDVVLKNYRRSLNANLKCPITKRILTTYTLTNFTVTEQEVPIFVPAGNLRLILNYFYNKIKTIRFVLHVRLEKPIQNRRK